MHISICNCFK